MSVVVGSELPGAGGGLACAAAFAVALARGSGEVGGGEGVTMIEAGAARRRGPTMLASESARELERRLREAGLEASARGRLAWVTIRDDEDWLERLGEALAAREAIGHAVVFLGPARLRELLGRDRPADAVLLRAALPAQRPLAALSVAELRSEGLRVRIATRAPGRVAARRALAGIDPGGDASIRAHRLARGLAGDPERRRPDPPGTGRRRIAAEAGQSMPLAIGGILALLFCALLLAAFGGAVTGNSRVQRAADLAALSGARAMRDRFDRLFEPVRLPDGSENPSHLSKSEYLRAAASAALEAARRNGVEQRRLDLSFPDAESFAPLRVRAEVDASLELAGLPDPRVAAHAEAEAVPPADPGIPPGAPATASGGGYSGRLAYRQGEPMRPDVAAAFDRLAAAARAAGLALIVNSGFRSDAEQAVLFAQNPDPQWVAPPGTSLHRCATELDLGPPAAYGWLAANAPRFGFLERYPWEPWHFGYTDGPPPCSAAGDQVGLGSGGPAGADAGDGDSAATSLPAFVPSRFRRAIAASAQRWNVSATLLAAQLMAESNFNPFAVSPAGAQGIAQFMPATAAAYGLGDPFDAAAAIDAQAHLMSDLLDQFGGRVELALAAYNAGPAPVAACGCVPSITETQAYVARILGLIGGAGAIAPPPALEVRLVA